MKVEEAKYSILEISSWFNQRELVVNRDYQRSSGLWPSAAKSYFIDSILRDFPFPKVYFHEKLDKAKKKPLREIVDGQQRVTTIVEFYDNKFALGKNAGEYSGLRFETLPEDLQDAFLAYTVSVDVIRNADRASILQMFRRMNAYTLPLNAAEKRHSEFFGDFKDFVNRTLDSFGPLLVDWKVFSSRQIVRMSDAEFVTEIALAVDEGVVSSSPAKLTSIYRKFEDANGQLNEFEERIWGAFQAVREGLSGIQDSYAVKPHIFHSLICALIHNRYGLPGFQEVQPSNQWLGDSAIATEQVRRLAEAFETKSLDKYADFVKASTEGGNRAPQRAIRIKWLCLALQGKLP